MFNLAAFRYRAILAAANGPIARVESGEIPFFGGRLFQAKAFLVEGLAPPRRPSVYSEADGTGAHASPTIARHIAISEALERWAYHATVSSPGRERFGFQVDRSTNGMAAFPGLTGAPARRRARLEAIERFSVLAWWEERLHGERRPTGWPGVAAVAIDGPPVGVAVVLHKQAREGFHCYGQAAARSFKAACDKALVELLRHEWVLRCRFLLHGSTGGGPGPTDLLERRSLFFAVDAGHELFRERLARMVSKPLGPAEVVADGEVKGPWSRYARVWRFAFRPPSTRFLEDDERYFFW